jgi:hypothetical protein
MLTQEKGDQLGWYVELGASFKRAAEELGLNERTARRWKALAEHGIPPYAELMYAVLDAEEKRRSTAENSGKREDPPADFVRTEQDASPTRQLCGAPL